MAMDLLQAGVDRSVIALWLGHKIGGDHANLSRSNIGDEGRRVCKNVPIFGKPCRFRPEDQLLGFLNSL